MKAKMTIDDLLMIMEIKSKFKAFASMNYNDFFTKEELEELNQKKDGGSADNR